jgi:hypothetical protein
MDVRSQIHAPAALPPGNNTGNHWVAGWVGPTVDLDGFGAYLLLPPGLEPRIV